MFAEGKVLFGPKLYSNVQAKSGSYIIELIINNNSYRGKIKVRNDPIKKDTSQ